MQVPDERRVVPAVAEIARRRDMTHVVLSPGTFATYSGRITAGHRKKGIGHGRVHNAAILVVPEVPDHMVFSISTQSRSPKVAKFLAAVRAEDWPEARALLTDMAQRPKRYMAVTSIPTKTAQD